MGRKWITRKDGEAEMGLTERHLFEDEEPELTERQLEDTIKEQEKAYTNGYVKGYHDASLVLPKEREAKTPIEYEHNGYWYYICPTCEKHEELFREWNYCPFCGQKVKWE